MSTGRRRAIFNSHGKPAWPSIAQKVSANSGTLGTITATLGAVPTSGNKLVAIFRSGQGTASQVNHSAPAGWTKVIGQNRSTVACISIWYKDAGAGEATSIAFSDAGATSAFIDVFEFSGLLAGTADRTGSEDGGATLTTTLPAAVITSAATTAARELVIASIGLSALSNFNNTWTNGFKQQTAGNTRLSTAAKTLTAIDTPSTNETWVTIRNAAGVMATFQAKTL